MLLVWMPGQTKRPSAQQESGRFLAAEEDGDGEITAAEFEAYKAEHCRAVVGGQPTC